LLIHIIPRYEKDGIILGWKPKPATEEEMNDALAKLKARKISFGEKKIEKLIVEKTEAGHIVRMP